MQELNSTEKKPNQMDEPYLFSKPKLVKRLSVEEREKFQAKPNLLNDPKYQPEVIKSAPNPKLGRLKAKDKFNSTSTIFMKDAIKAPDVFEIVRCLSKALYWNIKNLESKPKEHRVFIDIFNEELHPLGDGKTDFQTSPTMEEIEMFMLTIFNAQDLSAENGVMSAVYIERLVKLSGVTLHASNWRRIVLAALILASKVWEDLAVWNADFLSNFPNMDIDDVNKLEREFLTRLQFTVTLNAAVYAKYYFDLRSLSDRTEDNFPLSPLDQRAAEVLEARSRGVEESAKQKHVHSDRSKSVNPYTPTVSISLEQLSKTYGKRWTDDF